MDNTNPSSITSKKEWKDRKKNPWGTDYNSKENLGWLLRNAFGLSDKNKGIVDYINKEVIIDDEIKSEYTLVFAGDIMNLFDYKAEPSERLKDFVNDSDFFIANFEGIFTEESGGSIATQRHNYRVLDFLNELKNPKQTYLSVTNNHSGDFSEEIFNESNTVLEKAGFNVFGTKKLPFIEIDNKIRVLTYSKWSNLRCEWLVEMEEGLKHSKSDCLNILYPHWGYELELFPRPETVKIGNNFIENPEYNIDAIIGHHTHCPQPVTIKRINNIDKIIAYSLGDFTTGLKFNKYRYGIIIKLNIGYNKQEELKISKVSWEFTFCHPVKGTEKMLKIDLIDEFKYLSD